MADNEISNIEEAIIAGVGAITKTAETAGDLINELLKSGESPFEQGKVNNEELKHNKKASTDDTKGEPEHE